VNDTVTWSLLAERSAGRPGSCGRFAATAEDWSTDPPSFHTPLLADVGADRRDGHLQRVALVVVELEVAQLVARRSMR
jgi:hypothetical protein